MSQVIETAVPAPPRVSEGRYALEGGRARPATGARAALRRIPLARAAYGAGTRLGTELRLTARGWSSARRVRRDAEALQAFRRQRMREVALPALDRPLAAATLQTTLGEHGLDASIDGACLYLAPATLAALLDVTTLGYPADAALAIPASSLQAQAPESEEELWFEQQLAASARYARGDGPRLYDTIALGARRVPGFVVQTQLADGSPAPSAEIGALPLASSESLLDEALAGGATSTLHFGRKRLLGGREYLYQSIPTVGKPGRRDSATRWRQISAMLTDSDLSVEGRLVLDVGCNAGMMLACALADGAAWGIGWDLPEVSTRARALLGALGFTRAELLGVGLGPEYELEPTVPARLHEHLDGSVVLYLAIRHHAGFVADLASIPWRALVYEGGESESVEQLEEILGPLRAQTEFTVAAAAEFQDGEGRPRPLALLVR